MHVNYSLKDLKEMLKARKMLKKEVIIKLRAAN
jgi:hypothetical protein